MGSIKMVYDINHNELPPLTLESIGMFIEIGQVGWHSNNPDGKVWIHADQYSMSNHTSVKTEVDLYMLCNVTFFCLLVYHSCNSTTK